MLDERAELAPRSDVDAATKGIAVGEGGQDRRLDRQVDLGSDQDDARALHRLRALKYLDVG
jgi:hypothetical protein